MEVARPGAIDEDTPEPPGQAATENTVPVDPERAVGRAVLRLIELLSEDRTLRLGLEALAAQVLGRPETNETVAHPAVGDRAPEPPDPDGEAEVASGDGLGEPTEAAPAKRRRPRPETEPMDRSRLLALIEEATHGQSGEALGTLAYTLGLAAPPLEEAGVDGKPAAEAPGVAERNEPLRGLIARAHLKAEVARAHAEALRTGRTVDDALRHRARSEGASLWMLDLVDPDSAALDSLAECLDALGDAAELVLELGEQRPDDQKRRAHAIRKLAAVQSALRLAAANLRRAPDEDQTQAFAWVTAATSSERIFVERHMRLDDPLDPAHLGDVMSDVQRELDELRAATERQEARERRLKQVRYHAGRIAKGKGSDHDGDKIVEAVADLVAAGMPPSSLELRELLAPILDRLPRPDNRASGYVRVHADLELNRSRPVGSGSRRQEAHREVPGEVLRARELLRGTEVVILGGERRVERERELIEAFRLTGVRWCTLSEDPSDEEIQRAIGRDEVSVVLQLVRWSRHRFGDVGEAAADRHGKPFVRIPAGYNVAAVANAVIRQASERLG